MWAGLAHQVVETGPFISAASAWRGGITLAVWLIAVIVAWRVGSRPLRALHVVVGTALVLGVASMARIFGRPWFYLTLWAWGVTTLLVGAVAWTAVAWWKSRARQRATRRAHTGCGGCCGRGARRDPGDGGCLRGRRSPRGAAQPGGRRDRRPDLRCRCRRYRRSNGRGRGYLVRWSDAADIGSPGFGLLDELERRGLDVAADEFFHVPVTDHRTRTRAEADAQIHLATGGYIDAWHDVPDAVPVAEYDPRTAEQREEYADVRARFIERLHGEGLDDLVPLVDTNLFGISIDTRVSDADHADLARLIEIGQPMAVFIAPPPAEDDPTAL